MRFASDFDMLFDILDAPIHISTPRWRFSRSHPHLSCFPVLFNVFQTSVNLVILDMTDFYIILGMNWLSHYNVAINYITKSITLEISEKGKIRVGRGVHA